MKSYFHKIEKPGKKSFFLFDQKPLKRTIQTSYWQHSGSYFISLPRIIYKVNFTMSSNNRIWLDWLQIYATDSNLENLYELPLGNISANLSHIGYVCLGKRSIPDADCILTYSPNHQWPINEIENLCNKLVSYFWQSTFSLEIKDTVIRGYGWANFKTEISNPEIWQQKTKENPDWIPDKNDLILIGPYNEK